MTGCRPEVAMRLLKLLLILFVCAAAVLATVVVMLGPYEDAKAAYNKGDYAAVRRLLSSFILALAGNSDAQHNLGVMYYSGRGVPQDYVQAHMWWSLAAAKGDADAINNLDQIAAKMTPAQIAEAQKLAREWKPK